MKLGLVSAILPELSLEELLAFSALAREAPKQTRCPLMVDDEIDMEEFVVFKGVKVYICCGSCKETWAKNPEYFAVVCQKQAPQLKAVASKEIKPLRQLFCPVYANMRVHPKSLFIEHKGRTIYFSKKRAVSRFQANPKKYLKNLPERPG
ncbi:MAG: hypothetical protein O3A82_12535 [Verrucomicrobia bacterium]|nr:hypothetical protein [Verrucomicrobiota bacterium]MDA0725402.1 hypothetical protein [Verrucomicrobiota bacterium]MDA1047744.1 hypothetical protein [Verrucomicrobiota bacterium]